MAAPITGQKREWEAGAPPLDGAPPAEEPTEAVPAPAPEESSAPAAGEEPAAEAAVGAAPLAVDGAVAATTPANGAATPGAEAQTLEGEAVWLRQHIPQLQTQLSQLQQHHAALTQQQRASVAEAQHHAAAAQHYEMQMQQHHQQMQQQQQQQQQQAQWTEQVNPENGGTYYWNQVTGESTWTRPADYNPPVAGGGALRPAGGCGEGPNTKGPHGANLFVVRKMRRGEYDEFNDNDLRTEFGKFGTVTRAEMTMDKETGWSKGFGFVSFSDPSEADAAVAQVHGSWMAGREMKVEKTRED
uniref:Uncharacterized protein n=2 Tax=Phaeocystis antarctica TaxID=33657 RepID=A0A6T7R1G6_9EUKA